MGNLITVAIFETLLSFKQLEVASKDGTNTGHSPYVQWLRHRSLHLTFVIITHFQVAKMYKKQPMRFQVLKYLKLTEKRLMREV